MNHWQIGYEHAKSEAAAEIARLRAACHLEQVTQWKAENDRLRAELEYLRARNAEIEDALRMVVSGGYDEASRVFAAEVAARAVKPDYAPARDPSDHLACGNVG